MKYSPALVILGCVLFLAEGHTETTSNILKSQSPNEASRDNLRGDCSSQTQDSACQLPGYDNPRQLQQRLLQFDNLQVNPVFQNSHLGAEHKAKVEEADTTLQQVLFLHRHGDRTPINFPPKDNLKDEPLWSFYGPGQLTNRGKKRLYLLGNIMRQRYGSFLKKSVNKNQRVSRASGSLRCIESAQTFLASFLRLDIANSSDANELVWDRQPHSLGSIWQPASIQTMAAQIDGMLAESAECSQLNEEYLIIDQTETVKNISIEYKHEAEVLAQSYGMEMDHFFKWFWASSQLEVERSYFPDKIKPELLKIYDRLQEAGTVALGAYIMTLDSKRLRSGLLINDMVTNMNKFRDLQLGGASEKDPRMKKFLHYSAHDMTNIVLLGMLDNWDKYPARPNYASNIAIELHEKDGDWFVRFFYMATVEGPNSRPVELTFARCSGDDTQDKRCSLSKFESLMRVYMVDGWQNWMRECYNSLESIDPYSQGA